MTYRCDNRSLRASPSQGAFALLLFLMGISLVLGTGCPTPDTTPPGDVTNFTATPGNAQVALAWTNPADGDFAGVKVVRKTGTYPSSPADGAEVYSGPAQSFTDAGLSNGTVYYYVAFAYDSVSNYAPGVQASAVPTVPAARVDVLGEYAGLYDAIVGGLPVADPQGLSAILEASETLYRGGATCDAATVLAEQLLPAVQAAREASRAAGTEVAAGAFESLYNRARMLRFAMLSDLPLKDQCPGAERVGVEAAVVMDDAGSDNTQFRGGVTFGEPRFVTVTANEKVFTQLEIPGATANSGTPGEPAIPMLYRLVAVPQGAEVNLEVAPEDAEAIQLNLFPIQDFGVAANHGGPPPMGLIDDRRPFTQDEARYRTDAPFPADVGLLTPLGQCRDLRVFQLAVPAGQYNPVTQTLTLFKHVSINAQFSGGTGQFISGQEASPFESISEVSTGSVMNASKILEHIGPIIGQFVNQGEEFMILTHPDFKPAADKLAVWKNQKGIVTKVYVVNDSADPLSPKTADEIRDFMLDHYRHVRMRPSYALLIGDSEYIPPHYMTSNLDSTATIASDWPYCNMPPEGLVGIFDIFQDIAVGRLPVDTWAEANRVVDKIINYEKTPPHTRSFYQQATVCSQFQCCRKDLGAGHPGYDQALFIWPCETARAAMVAKGYTVDRIYGKMVDAGNPGAQPPDPPYTGNTTPRFYWNGTPLPSGLGLGSGFPWNGTANDVVNAWNNGRFLIIHVDHGSPEGWGMPDFNRDNVRFDLNDSDLVPVLFSINCSSGYYDNEIVDPANSGELYFTERLIRYPGRAVGVIASTRTSWIWPNAYQLQGFVDAIFPDTLPSFGGGTVHHRLGDILVHGNLYLITQINVTVDLASAGDQIHMYHLFGDPTLEIRTAYPYDFEVAKNIGLMLSGSKLSAQYPTEGAVLTAFQENPNGVPVPLGRGSVKDGKADFYLVNEPVPGASVQVSAGIENTISELLPTVIPTPPGNVLRFLARGGDGVVHLQWINPADASFVGVVVQRKTGAYPAAPTDGTTVYQGNAEQFADTDVVNGTQYYYAAYSYDSVANHSTGVEATAAPMAASRR